MRQQIVRLNVARLTQDVATPGLLQDGAGPGSATRGGVLSRLAPYRAAGSTGSAFLGCRWMGDCDGLRRLWLGGGDRRPDLTAQGYRRFRCRDCGKQFNERSDGVLNRASLPSDIIAFVVFCRLRYRLTLRVSARSCSCAGSLSATSPSGSGRRSYCP